MDRKQLIIEHIKMRLADLTELGKEYSEDKIEKLATSLASTNKTLTEINTLVDNKFAYQQRKIKHDNYLASLKEYYISSIDKLKKGNNVYLLSYDQGVKVLEQAYIKEDKELDNKLKLVTINKEKKGYKKENSINNDYELIMSDIAYLLNIPYAATYRIFDKDMEPQGILNLSFEEPSERFLNFEETLHYIKEESSQFNLKQELIDYHDKHYKYGLQEVKKEQDYKDNIEYVFKLFKALPDITEENIEELKKDYLNMKIFELLTNSLDNNLNNIGLMVNKENKKKYTYRLSPSYNKYIVKMDNLKDNQTICNFYIVDKEELLRMLVDNYYDYIKEILNLISTNKDTLLPLIKQVVKEHLEYDLYDKYIKVIENNYEIIASITAENNTKTEITEQDKKIYDENNKSYDNRIAPFVDNYVADTEEKGNTLLIFVVTTILFITIGIILLAIFAISRLDM